LPAGITLMWVPARALYVGDVFLALPGSLHGQRTLLFDLDTAIQRLAAEVPRDHPGVVQLTGVYHNLLRRWAEM